MKLLITTQAVDEKDPILGFFVAWVREFAKQCETVEIICLREGAHTLPANVRVHALGMGNKLSRSRRFYKVLKTLEYNAVFVHMNPEYLLLGGLVWRRLGTRTVLWYTHKSVNLRLRLAVRFADVVLTASKESFRLPTDKVRIMGHGIDTEFFSPDPHIMREDWWLSAGRLTASKRHDLAIRAAAQAGKRLRIVGDGPERGRLEALVGELGATVVFTGGLDHLGVRDEFRRASLFLHMSETGSLDKMILEAVACGCPVRTNDPALKFLEKEGPEYVRREHSLSALIPRIVAVLQEKV
jgi:glycosyltransferase involved in cell wall biosynthesis